jgi:hypothetical protein
LESDDTASSTIQLTKGNTHMENDLQTLGHAAAIYQRDPREIEAALLVVQAETAAAAGDPIPQRARPALRLNGLAYFVAAEIVAAVRWLAGREQQEICT